MLDARVQKIFRSIHINLINISALYGWIARSTGNPGQSSARGTALANGHRHAGELCASTIDPRRREFLYSHQLLRVLVVWIWLDLTVMVLNCDNCAKVEFSQSVYVGWIDALYLLDNSFYGIETEDIRRYDIAKTWYPSHAFAYDRCPLHDTGRRSTPTPASPQSLEGFNLEPIIYEMHWYEMNHCNMLAFKGIESFSIKVMPIDLGGLLCSGEP